MNSSLTLQTLAVPVAVFLVHALMAAIVALRQGLRRREAGVFVGYLAAAVCWILFFAQGGLRVAWPLVPWERLAAYVFIGLGIAFWAFARAFLQKPRLPTAGWVSAIVVAAALAVLDTGLVALPPFALTIGTVIFTGETTVPVVAVAAAAIYVGVALVTAIVEYVRRPSPLHRNRITYWLFGAVALIAGLTLILVVRQTVVEIAGIGVHLLGAVLLTYTVVRPQLPNIGTGVRRLLGYFLTALVPVAVTVVLSSVVLYFLDRSPLFDVRYTASVLIGIIVLGIIVFVLYQPVSSLTRLVTNRLLFGRRHEAQMVVREYSQAITRILSLEPLVETAMQIIDRALGIQRGTLLVVEETRGTGWTLRVIEGLNVSADQPQLTLAAGTPLAAWLVERGDPLHQYTLDVDPRFDVLDPAEREAWRGLNMEVFFPIKRSDSFIGMLALGLRRSGRPYGDQDINLLQTLADQTAVALENAALFDRVQRRAEQLALLNEIGRVITSSLDLEPAVGLIAERIESAFPGAAGFVFLLEELQQDLVLQTTFGLGGPDVDSFRVRLGQGLVGSVAVEGKPALATGLSRDIRYSQDVEGVLVPGAESALCVPVIAQGETIGVILVASPDQTSFGSAELNLLDSIGSFASIAIENARLVAAREARLRHEVEALRIEIDEIKRTRRVSEITDTDYFRGLQTQAQELRRARAAKEQKKKGLFDRLQEEVDKRASSETAASPSEPDEGDDQTA